MVSWTAVAIAGALSSILLLQPPTPQPARTALRYVANAGALVSVEGRRLLIDAPIRDGIPPYPISPSTERQRLERAAPPYDDVDAVLVTHWHEDHFSAAAVAAHLTSNPRAVLISSPEVVARVREAQPQLPSTRVRAVLPAPGQAISVAIGGVPVRVLRIRHNPTRRMPEQHVGFLIGATATVLHVGDADPRPSNFALLAGLPRVDLALLPFWYVVDDESRAFVQSSIAPRRMFAMHLPPEEVAGVAEILRGARVAVALPGAPGSAVVID